MTNKPSILDHIRHVDRNTKGLISPSNCAYYKSIFFSKKDVVGQQFLMANNVCPDGRQGEVRPPNFLKGKKGVTKRALKGNYLGFFITEYTYNGRKYYQGVSRMHMLHNFAKKNAFPLSFGLGLTISSFGVWLFMMGGYVILFEAPNTTFALSAIQGATYWGIGVDMFYELYNKMHNSKTEIVYTKVQEKILDLFDEVYDIETEEMDEEAFQQSLPRGFRPELSVIREDMEKQHAAELAERAKKHKDLYGF